MYNKESKQDSIEIITWTALGTVASILLTFIGRGIYDKFNEGLAFEYIGLTFLFIIVSFIFIRIFFGIKNSIEKSRNRKNGKSRFNQQTLNDENTIDKKDKDFFKKIDLNKKSAEVDNKWPEGALN